MKQLMTAACIALAATLISPGSAGASCIGPTVLLDGGEVEPGDTIAIEGIGWGDNCYDTGPPPEGQGALGVPASDIEIVFLQDDIEILVATGDADAAYEFGATITIPSGLQPGKFDLVARTRLIDANVQARAPLAMLASETEVEATIAEFDPSDAVFEQPVFPPVNPQPDDEGQSPTWLLAVGIGLLVVLLGTLLAVRSAKR
jgi:hypothetical protein